MTTEPGSQPLTTANGRHETFCQEFLVDLNATQAAIRTGYSVNTAEAQSSRLLRKVNIHDRIEFLKQARSRRTQIDADWLLRRLGNEVNADLADLYDPETGEILPIHRWPLIWRQGLVTGIDVQQVTTIVNQAIEDEETGDIRQEVTPVPAQVVKIKVSDRVKRLELIGRHINVKAFEDAIRAEIPGIDKVAEILYQIKQGLPSGRTLEEGA